MRLRSFVLADAVVVQPDGKAVIFGAGIGRIIAQTLPWSQPQLAAYITVEIDQEPAESVHTFTVEVLDPEETAIVNGRVTGSFAVPNRPPNALDGELLSINFAPVFAALQFSQSGLHYVRLAFDDQEMDRFPLAVTLEPREEPTTWTTIGQGGSPAAPAQPSQ